MAGGASAQIPAMAQAATQVDQAGQTLAGIRTRVGGAVANTQGGYQSEAATVFRNVMDQWGADFQKIVNGLNQIHEALTATHRSYQASVDTDRASANSIMSALNNPGA
jgi:WXG100 family type VII secretion target